MQHKLLVGLLLLTANESQGQDAVFSRVRSMVDGKDPILTIAKKLDELGDGIDKEAYQELANFLERADLTRDGILASVSQFFSAFGNLAAQRSTDSTSFDVQHWLSGGAMTIYVLGPPAGVAAFDVIYRLWLGTLVTTLARRQAITPGKALVVADLNESFELPAGLVATVTNNRSVSTWLVASDLSEIDSAFGSAAETVLSSMRIIQILRPRNHRSAARLAELLGVTVQKILETRHNETTVMLDAAAPIRLSRLDSTS